MIISVLQAPLEVNIKTATVTTSKCKQISVSVMDVKIYGKNKQITTII